MAKGLTIPLMRDSNRLSAITGSMRVAPKKTLSRITHRIPTANLGGTGNLFPPQNNENTISEVSR